MFDIQKFSTVTELVDFLSSNSFLSNKTIVHLTNKVDILPLVGFFCPNIKTQFFTNVEKRNIFILNQFIRNESQDKSILVS